MIFHCNLLFVASWQGKPQEVPVGMRKYPWCSQRKSLHMRVTLGNLIILDWVPTCIYEHPASGIPGRRLQHEPARITSHPAILLHQYRDKAPFPGWTLQSPGAPSRQAFPGCTEGSTPMSPGEDAAGGP